MKRRQLIVVCQVFLPFAAGYFLSYLYRVVNAVISVDLTAELALSPSSLGLLTATYFIAFASFQVPLGVLLDRFGPRRTEAFLLVFAALGALVFARAEGLGGLILGRALIGLGVSACLMAAFKAYALWFDRSQWPLVNGFQMASGGLGALTATSPVEMLLGQVDWRSVFMVLAALTLAVALLVFLVVPERTTASAGGRAGLRRGGVREIFTSMAFWRSAPLVALSQASFLAIQGLWAGPWLRQVAGLDRADSARVLFWIALAMICGWISLGSLTGRLQARGIPVVTTAVAAMTAFMLVQLLLLTVPLAWAVPVWMLFGFSGTAGIIAYAGLTQAFPLELSGRVTTAVNLLVFVCAFMGQWLIGVIIDFWPQATAEAASAAGFRAGFGLMLALQAAGLVWYWLAGRFIQRPRDNE